MQQNTPLAEKENSAKSDQTQTQQQSLRLMKELKKPLLIILFSTLFMTLFAAVYLIALRDKTISQVKENKFPEFLNPTVTLNNESGGLLFSGRIAYLIDDEIWVTDALGNKIPTGYFSVTGYGAGADMGISGEILTSPNGEMVAFVNREDNQVWLMNVLTLKAHAVSHEGSIGNENCTRTEFFLTLWSPDSSKLLYFMSHVGVYGMGWSPTSDKIPSCYKNNFGLHIADLEKNISFPIQKKWLGEDDSHVLYAEGREAEGWKLHYFVDWSEKGVVFEQMTQGEQTYKERYISIDPHTGESRVLIEDSSLQKFTSLTLSSSGKKWHI